jgi:hypothetical protein
MIRFDPAPTNRATCNMCYKKIKKDTMMLRMERRVCGVGLAYNACEQCIINMGRTAERWRLGIK